MVTILLPSLARLPPDLDLDALARSTKAIQRSRKVTDGKDLLRLALARGPGGLSLNQTAAWASMSGLAELSDPGLKQRVDNAVPFLKALMEQQLAERAGSATLRWPGRCLRVVDGTNISQPASQDTDWRVHAGYDLGTGGFVHLELTDNHGAEPIERGAPKPGEVRIAATTPMPAPWTGCAGPRPTRLISSCGRGGSPSSSTASTARGSI